MTTEIKQNVLIATLDDGKANAVGHTLIDQVNAALDESSKSAAAILLVGRPGVFSAGFDLKEFQKGPDATTALVNKGATMLLRLFQHPQPVVMACTGHAVAAGALMLLAADTRLGAEGQFSIGLNETAIGMPLPEFGMQLAAARLSRRHLTSAVVQSRMFDPQAAVDAGYLDQVEPADALVDTALQTAAQLAELPAEAYATNKLGSRAAFIAAIEKSLA